MTHVASLSAWSVLAALAAGVSAQDTSFPPNQPAAAGPAQPLAARGAGGGGIQAATSNPGRLTTLFTNLPASTTSDVPGLAPAKFQASTSSTLIFDRPWISHNGAYWVLTADTDLATTEDEVLLLNGAVVGREGTPAPWEAGQTWGTLDTRISVNDSGDYAFTTNVGPSTVNDDYAIYVTPGPTYTVVFREADPIAALPGATWDDNIDSPVLLNDGRLSVSDDGIDGVGVTVNDDEIIVLDNVLIAREGITIPTGQAGGATNAWENFSLEDTWFDASGANHIILGDLLGATTSDQVAVVNNAVVLQEGVVIPGSSFVSPIGATGIRWVTMDGNGVWYAHGQNADGQDWIVRNGAVAVATGDALANVGAVRYFSGTIDGAQEVPASGSTATGTIRMLIDTSSNTLHYQITLTGLVNTETAAHIHGFAGPGVNAGVLYNLPLGNSKVGTINYLESEEQGLLSGLTYVNVHTNIFPGGEIRGQILPDVERWAGPTATPATFYAVAAASSGDWVAMGTTNAPDNWNGVIVLNGTHVLVRENDPLDIDGNGLFDDDAYIRTFGNDDLVLAPDGTLYFTATIQNSALAQTGQGFFRRSGGNLQQAYCFGDGTGTACPCGNGSAVGAMGGCLNSLGLAGRLDSSGIASLTADSLLLSGTNMPNSSALYFQGTTQLAGGAGVVFGDGLRCAGGAIIRLGTKSNVAGASQFPAGGDPTVSVRGLVGAPGLRTYQVWYRNAAAFCSVDTFNLTNGVAVTWGP
ncbi:MAG: CHRD domain-containing protein [Planctomycetes bacterium]|nr:CHRD domain-containing protein [Planctomycetota bacterium]